MIGLATAGFKKPAIIDNENRMTPVDRLALTYLRSVGAKSRWVDTSYGSLYNLELVGRGDLGTVVLIHGLSARCSHFFGMVRRLRHHFSRLVIPDLLGHGFSPILSRPMRGPDVQQALDEVLDVLIDEPAVFYGNSLGGYCAIRYASRSPAQVRVLTVNSPGGGAFSGLSMEKYMNRFRVKTNREAMEFLDRYFGKRIPMKRLIARRVIQQLNAPHIRSFIDEISMDDSITAEQLSRLSMPVLFLWGQRDQIVIPEQLDFFRNNLPRHARLEEPEGYGHAPYIEHPNHLSTMLLDFIRSHPG